MIDIHVQPVRSHNGCPTSGTSVPVNFPAEHYFSDSFRHHFRVLEFSRKTEVRLAPEMIDDDAICFVRRGRVRMIARFPSSRSGCRSILTDIIPPGGFFGQPSRWRLQAIHEKAVAADGTELWVIGVSHLEQLLSRLPGAAAFFCRMLDQQSFHQKQRRVHVTALDVPARLAATLLELSEQFGVRSPASQGVRICGISQQDLADLIGASRSFVSTLINVMKQQGFLMGIGRSIVISRSDKLEQLADGRERLQASNLPRPGTNLRPLPEALDLEPNR